MRPHRPNGCTQRCPGPADCYQAEDYGCGMPDEDDLQECQICHAWVNPADLQHGVCVECWCDSNEDEAESNGLVKCKSCGHYFTEGSMWRGYCEPCARECKALKADYEYDRWKDEQVMRQAEERQ